MGMMNRNEEGGKLGHRLTRQLKWVGARFRLDLTYGVVMGKGGKMFRHGLTLTGDGGRDKQE